MTERLKAAIGSYGHTAALKDRSIQPAGVELDLVEVTPLNAAFRRMVRDLEFDVSEMAVTTYLVAREHAKPFTALPVFPFRGFPHGAILYNDTAGVQRPADLEGKKVGVRAYTVTTGVWARGVLARQYGVNPDKVTWVVVDEEHVREYALPANVEAAPAGASLPDLLASGAIAAGIGLGRVDAPHVKPLLPDVAAAEREWLDRSGAYPINHTIVVKDELLAREPDLAQRLYDAFEAAKQRFMPRLDSGELTGDDAALARRRSLVGADPIPYGVEPNRRTLETLIQIAQDQHIVTRPLAVDELFVPVTTARV
jgi:4,5-dihydroxyphthalate decarboxylase